MKKIILLLSVFFLSAPALQAQDQPWRYHPLSEFQGDTVKFLLKNFYPAQPFFGKSVADIIDILDREIPVKQVMYTAHMEPNDSVFQTMELIFDDRKQFVVLDQLHFWVTGFEHEGEYLLVRDVKSLLGFGPREIVALTPDLRERLKRLVVVHDTRGANFTAVRFSLPQ